MVRLLSVFLFGNVCRHLGLRRVDIGAASRGIDERVTGSAVAEPAIFPLQIEKKEPWAARNMSHGNALSVAIECT